MTRQRIRCPCLSSFGVEEIEGRYQVKVSGGQGRVRVLPVFQEKEVQVFLDVISVRVTPMIMRPQKAFNLISAIFHLLSLEVCITWFI